MISMISVLTVQSALIQRTTAALSSESQASETISRRIIFDRNLLYHEVASHFAEHKTPTSKLTIPLPTNRKKARINHR